MCVIYKRLAVDGLRLKKTAADMLLLQRLPVARCYSVIMVYETQPFTEPSGERANPTTRWSHRRANPHRYRNRTSLSLQPHPLDQQLHCRGMWCTVSDPHSRRVSTSAAMWSADGVLRLADGWVRRICKIPIA